MFVLHEDASFLVLVKPSGLLSVPGRLPENKRSLASLVQSVFPEALVVHRLDCETSGLMIMARDPESHRRLNAQFHDRVVQKLYLALVSGTPEAAYGKVDLPLICDWPNRPKQKVDFEIGKPAQTLWRCLRRDESNTLVALKPITGRSHQLRVHMLALGHPILGDRLYAEGAALAARPRLMLHAARILFRHPFSGAPLCFTLNPAQMEDARRGGAW